MSSYKKRLPINYIVGFVVGIFAGISMTFVLSALLAMLIVHGDISMDWMVHGTRAVIVLSGSAASLATGLAIQKNWLPVCIGAGGMYFAFLWLMAVLFFDGVYHSIPLTLLLSVVGPVVIGLTGILRKSRTNLGYPKRRFR